MDQPNIVEVIEDIDDDSLIDMPDAPPPQPVMPQEMPPVMPQEMPPVMPQEMPPVMPQEMIDLQRDFEEPIRKQIRGKTKRKLSLKQFF